MQNVGPPPPYPVDPSRGPQAPSIDMNRLSPEERKIMAECQWESFMFRAFPIGMIFGTAVTAGVRAGKIAAAGRFGALPKAFVAGTFGYFLGKASYTGVCRDKILERAPSSNLARAIRAASGIPEPDGSGVGGMSGGGVVDGSGYLTDAAPGNMPAAAAPQQQADDYSDYFASSESEANKPIDRERREGTLSYDMLRNQHRERTQQLGRAPPPPPPPPSMPDQGYMQLNTPPPPTTPPPSRRPPGSTNKYGDEGFE